MNDMKNDSCSEFTEKLFSKAPVPGGGGAAALAGALSVSLCAMAGNLTLGKKKYAQYESDIERMTEQAERLRIQFLNLIDQDAEAFEPLSRVYSMPKDDPEYSSMMNSATINACSAPLEMMQCACATIELLDEMSRKCSRLLLSDVGCGAALALAALKAASMNVFVNTKSIRGQAEADKMEAMAKNMLDKYSPIAEKITSDITKKLMGI